MAVIGPPGAVDVFSAKGSSNKPALLESRAFVLPIKDALNLAPLTRMLKDEAAGVREAAAKGLGAAAPTANQAVAEQVQELKSRDVAARKRAAEVLGEILPDVEAARLALRDALEDRDPTVRRGAAEALGVISSAGPSAFAALDRSTGEGRVLLLGFRPRHRTQTPGPVIGVRSLRLVEGSAELFDRGHGQRVDVQLLEASGVVDGLDGIGERPGEQTEASLERSDERRPKALLESLALSLRQSFALSLLESLALSLFESLVGDRRHHALRSWQAPHEPNQVFFLDFAAVRGRHEVA